MSRAAQRAIGGSKKTSSPNKPHRRIRSLALIVAGLALLTLLAFLPTFGNGFIAFDDIDWLTANPDYNPPSFAKFGRSWTQAYPDLYTPMLWTVWGLLAFISRTTTSGGQVVWDPMPYHAFNVAAHLATVMMVFLVLRRLVRSDMAAFFGAALFAVHPIQVEAVAWVSGMKTPLSGFFSIWAIWHYLRFSELRYGSPVDPVLPRANPGADRRRAWLHYAVSTAAFLLAIITKPTVIVLPLIVALVEWMLRKRPIRSLIVPLGPWVVLSIAFALINNGAQPAPDVFRPAILQRALISLDSLGFYLGKVIAPYPLLPDYGRTPQKLVAWGWARPGWVVASIVLAAALVFWRRVPWATVAIATFALGAVTTLGLVPYDYQSYSTVSDRYVYLSMFGIALGTAALLQGSRADGKPRRWPVGVGICVVGACTVLTLMQCRRWHDTQRVFQYTLRYNPESLAAFRGLSEDAFTNNRYPETLEIARRGLEVRPGDGGLLQWVGTIYFLQRDYERAAEAFEAGAKSTKARSENLNGLGQCYAELRRPADAQAAFEEAIKVWPENALAHENLGILFGRLRQWDQAIAEFDRALAIDPTLTRAGPARQSAKWYRDRPDGGTMPSR